VNKRTGAAVLAAGSAALAFGLGAPAPVTATTSATWTVTPGGSSTDTASTITVKDTHIGTTTTCTVTMTIVWKSGSGLPGSHLGKIRSVTFTGCSPLTVTARALPWYINATGYNATTGTLSGNITGIDTGVSGPGCSATIDGTAAGANNGKTSITYTSNSAVLKLTGTGNLHTWNVRGCFGLISNGDPISVTASDALTPRQKITSP
jgi:hypothetical protein